jgi:integrase
MAGKQAKILTRQQVRAALHRARRSRYPQRDRVMILLSVKAGLRAGEIAKLTWSMLLDADGRLGQRIELHDNAAKKRSGRTIPLHPELRRALLILRRQSGAEGAVIRSERSGSRGMRPSGVVNWFRQLYCDIGLSARRTPAAARLSPTQRGSCSKLAAACATCSSLPATNRSSKPKRISTAAPGRSGA